MAQASTCCAPAGQRRHRSLGQSPSLRTPDRGPLLPACLPAEEVPSRLRPVFEGFAASLQGWLAPLRGSFSVTAMAGDAMREDARQSELVKRLRSTMM